jgi:hypothetical protein
MERRETLLLTFNQRHILLHILTMMKYGGHLFMA